MAKEKMYYTIKLQDGTVAHFESHGIRLNGLPLRSLNTMPCSGRLDFVAVPMQAPGAPQPVHSFKSRTGLIIDMDIGNAAPPAGNRTVSGRITGVVADPADSRHQHEHVTFVFHTIK